MYAELRSLIKNKTWRAISVSKGRLKAQGKKALGAKERRVKGWVETAKSYLVQVMQRGKVLSQIRFRSTQGVRTREAIQGPGCRERG